MASKLYIYDSSSEIDRKQAVGRFSGDSKVVTLAASSVAELHKMLASFVATKRTFQRVLFQTHGNSGEIFFNHKPISASNLRTDFAGYHQLFPNRTKVYFDGCNVAEGKKGWDFLAVAGEAFLQNQGGITMGYTSLGGGMPGWIPLIGGHTVHLWGDVKFIEFGSGAVELSRFSSNGASLSERIKAGKKLESGITLDEHGRMITRPWNYVPVPWPEKPEPRLTRIKIDAHEPRLLAFPSDVLFDFGKSSIRVDAIAALKELAAIITKKSIRNATIEGHTDSTGGRDYNIRLSKARAEAVRMWLIANGVLQATFYSTVGKGESTPIALNETSSGRQQNRRVLIRFA